jgi:hypothetical protein
MFLWLWTGLDIFHEPLLVAPWAALVAFLMVSNLATFSWGSLKLRSHVRLGSSAGRRLLGGALFTAPWPTLSIAAILYAAMIPFSILSYRKVKRQRAALAPRGPHRTRARSRAAARTPWPRRPAHRNLAAERREDLVPIFPNGKMDERGGPGQHQRKEKCGSDMSHSF